MATDNKKTESASSDSPNPLVTGNSQTDNPSEVSEGQSKAVADSINLYNEYRNVLHGIAPAWELPDLDNNVKLSFSEISG